MALHHGCNEKGHWDTLNITYANAVSRTARTLPGSCQTNHNTAQQPPCAMSVIISYSLNISPSAKERLSQRRNDDGAEARLTFDLAPSGERDSESGESYYANLSKAIGAATIEIGDRLTEWRDAVGDEEKVKEKSVASLTKGRKTIEDESDEEEPI